MLAICFGPCTAVTNRRYTRVKQDMQCVKAAASPKQAMSLRPNVFLVFALVVMACGDGRVTRPIELGRIDISSGDRQRGDPGRPLALPIAIIVRDASGAPVSGVAVTWTAEDGGSLEPLEG